MGFGVNNTWFRQADNIGNYLLGQSSVVKDCKLGKFTKCFC